MSIPITCAGCKAAFDVPDTLAGKTIRCTSCKAQMTVPDEAPVEAVDAVEAVEEAPAKKPFGSGVKPAVAAVPKPAPKPAPAPAAKTSPAKPAAKAIAAKAVAEDDEDEADAKTAKKDGKSEKAKPGSKAADGPKKAGITGSTKKRRSDDDDDDDEDAPRKKKKAAQGGSGGMIAIIAGATVALAVVAGLGIYLASGSSSKNETAANTTNTSGTGGSGTAGTGGAGTTPAAGPAGPGRPAGVPAGPATGINSGAGVDGDGPTPPTPPGPQGGLTPLPPPGSPAGGMNPPAGGAGGNPFAGLGKVERLGTPGAWAAFTGDGYTADFPGAPETKNETVNGIGTKITGVGTRDGSAAVALYIQFPGEAAANPRQLLDLMVTGMRQQPPFRGKTAADVTIDGNPGKEFDLTDGASEGRMRLTVVKDRVYMFAAGGPSSGGKPAMPRGEVDRFFNSIKITYKGDLVAGGPGAIPGMPGAPLPPGGGNTLPPPGSPGVGTPPGVPPGMMPPGIGAGAGVEGPGGTVPGIGQPPGMSPMPPLGGIGQPPGGIGVGSGDGIKKAKIENFYAGAFDADKNEFYAVDERAVATGPKKGWLRRYSYPEFKVLGRYQLPQMASRAVIDPKAGLLYAATVTSPAAAQANGTLNLLDNASGAGDIAVYDLKQVRDGKTADGKELKDGAELKPVATISLKTTIHALELSDDGKSLYALVTPTGTGARKSSLSVIDTETRKETRTAFATAMRDMAKTADGKNLIIVEEFSLRTKSAGVGTFDFGSMSLVNVTSFPGGVMDVAPIKGGGALVTVLPVNNAPAVGGPAPGGGLAPLGPPGGPGGPPPGLGGIGGGGQPNHQNHFRLYLLNEKGSTELDLGPGQRFSNGGYAEFDAENKKLFVSSWRATGLDVFDVTDPAAATGLKLTATVQTAGREPIGGHCLVSPDGKTLVFHTGVVMETSNIGGGIAGGAAPGFPGGGIAPPGGGVGVPPGGMGLMPLPPPGNPGGGGNPGAVPPGMGPLELKPLPSPGSPAGGTPPKGPAPGAPAQPPGKGVPPGMGPVGDK